VKDGVYIKMCEKAVAQGLMPRTEGGYKSWWYIKPIKRTLPLYVSWDTHVGTFLNFSNTCRNFTLSECVPVFSQDQLQEMLKGSPADIYYRFRRFIDGQEGNPWTSLFEKYLSFEGIWLAFVMKEKFNKVWNGDDFITAA